MANTLVSPGVSVSITDASFYIPASAPTVPLFFVATQANKLIGLDPTDPTIAAGTQEFGKVRTITSKSQCLNLYGVPSFLVDGSGNPQHGDARNEYGLLAIHQFLDIANVAYVVRAGVDLTDAPVANYSTANLEYTATSSSSGNGSMSGLWASPTSATAEQITVTAISGTQFSVVGSVSGQIGLAQVGVQFNSGTIRFTVVAGSQIFIAGDFFQFDVVSTLQANPLGANDAAKRVTIVESLIAQISGNQDVRSEIYEYNIIICPGYFETASSLLNLTLDIQEEAFVISDTPFTKTPEDTATWSNTTARAVSCNIAYYYPNALMAHPYTGLEIFVPASGVALKTIAYSDSVSEVFFAPAGLRRGLITGIDDIGYITGTLGTATTFVSAPLNVGQRNVLYDYFKNINPITYLPGRGFVVFGQKTSYNAASALDRINVMRLLMMIRRDLRKGSLIYLFEPNDTQTQANLKHTVDNYLGDIMTRRGLYDFISVTDSSVNTPAVVDANQLVCQIGLQPEKAVEFLYIPITVYSTGATMG